MLLIRGGLVAINRYVGPFRRHNFWAYLRQYFQVDLTMEAKSTLSVDSTVP